jgi:probable HAF family extracellular repeat protein
MTLRKLVLSLAVLLLATVPLALAQGTYTQIDYPGAAQTQTLGINTIGDVVGGYQDSSGTLHGFLLSAGTYTTIDYLGSTTALSGINDLGQIVGNALELSTGFLYDVQTQTFRTISVPRATLTETYCINNHSIIGGFAQIPRRSTVFGFALVRSGYDMIFPPGASLSVVVGVTRSDELILGATVNGVSSTFSYNNGVYSQIPIPPEPNIAVIGVNPQGTAFVGYYNPSSTTSTGFVYRKKLLTTLQFPGSGFTQAYGINSSGEVVGFFEDASGNGHGFLWTPPADAGKK